MVGFRVGEIFSGTRGHGAGPGTCVTPTVATQNCTARWSSWSRMSTVLEMNFPAATPSWIRECPRPWVVVDWGTRARATQLMNLTLLVPEIQERLLLGQLDITERRLRRVLCEANWNEQMMACETSNEEAK